MPKFVKVATTSEIPPGGAKCVEPEGKMIALFNLGGSFYAIDNSCTHVGGPLAEGAVDGEAVECPWHGARFNIKSGDVLSAPAGENVLSYKVRVSGSDIEIEV
ncbi:MAG: non-heme iron oxygenase ferredoxin subunit [Candidatus Omnitrophica bacterium]|nr:non-heme iron oxygenase ferredoxin subunit [Candidatus Omnitrophota bacterium]